MRNFNTGMDAIDTKRKIPVTVVDILPTNCYALLYVVETWGEHDYYIVDEDTLIPYDKHWDGWED